MLSQCSEGWCPPAICKEVAPRVILSNPPHSNCSQEFCKITFPINNVVWGDEVTIVDCSGSFFYSQFIVLYQVPSVVTSGLKVGWSHPFLHMQRFYLSRVYHVQVLIVGCSGLRNNWTEVTPKYQLAGPSVPPWQHFTFPHKLEERVGGGIENRKLKESRWWPIK